MLRVVATPSSVTSQILPAPLPSLPPLSTSSSSSLSCPPFTLPSETLIANAAGKSWCSKLCGSMAEYSIISVLLFCGEKHL